mgnify:CR=1 FL=1
MIRDNIRIALKAIVANKMRSILTTLGIIIGVAAVIAVVSVVQGLNHAITREFAEVGSRFIQVMAFPDPNDPDLAGREVLLTYEDGLAVMDEVPMIGAFTPVFMQAVRAGNRDRTQSASLLGVGVTSVTSRNWTTREDEPLVPSTQSQVSFAPSDRSKRPAATHPATDGPGAARSVGDS